MKSKIFAFCMSVSLLLSACASTPPKTDTTTPQYVQDNLITKEISADATKIILSDDGITVSGEAISEDSSAVVYAARDIVFYETGKDFTYGEGTQADAHTQEEADKHTVVHITQPGQYILSGMLSAGQIAVDLGKDAEENPDAVVTLVLDNANITCSVAPAIIFYNVYECGSADEETATMDVDTATAGANVIIADGTINNIRGAYVSKIYKSVELNEEKTEVIDSKKLHKYDGAFYSKMSMNIYGGKASSGVLNIYAKNEGLDSELHLTLYSGNIHIESGNDGINTNEDNVSITRILGGTLNIAVNGSTGEGDGIDSNGWLIIEGGVVTTSACGFSGDAGIDADKGIYIQGGVVCASGNMLDHVQGNQNHIVFTFSSKQTGKAAYTVKNELGSTVLTCSPSNDFHYLIVSSPFLSAGNYTFWKGDAQLYTNGSGGAIHPGGMGHQPGPLPDGEMPEPPEGMGKPNGNRPESPENPDGNRPEPPVLPNGNSGGIFPNLGQSSQTMSPTFLVFNGANYFQVLG